MSLAVLKLMMGSGQDKTEVKAAKNQKRMVAVWTSFVVC